MIDRRRFIAVTAAASVISAARGAAALGVDGELRFGLTAVVVREYMRSFNQLAAYLSLRLGHPVSFVLRRSYDDIMGMLARGELDAAWICGYPYIQPRYPEYLALLVAPVYLGAPLYRSLLIVPKDSPARRIADLRGKVFAFSDPNSNSGYLVPRGAVADAGFDPDQFFRLTFFTYNHAETVLAVARRMADGGAVDSYVYDVMQKYEPETVAATQVIARSPTYGFPPIVARQDLAPEVRDRLRDALVGMKTDPEAAPILRLLMLDGFAEVSPALYQPIRALAQRAQVPALTPAKEQP